MSDSAALIEEYGIPPEFQQHFAEDAPKAPRIALAQGLIPIPPRVQLPLLMALSRLGDKRLTRAARKTLTKVPPNLVVGNTDRNSHRQLLGFLAVARKEPAVQQHLALQPTLPEKAWFHLAAKATEPVLEVIANNQARITELPEIYWYLEANEHSPKALIDKVRTFLEHQGIRLPAQPEALRPKPKAPTAPKPVPTGDVGALAQALGLDDQMTALLTDLGVPLRPEWVLDVRPLAAAFGAAAAPVAAPAEAEAPPAAPAPLPEVDASTADQAGEEEEFDSRLLAEGESPQGEQDDENLSLELQIRSMSPGQKIKLAYVGNSTARKLLLRDSNKLVACAVVKSGRMSDQEVIDLSANRSVDGEVIRLVAMNKEFLRSYQIRKNLTMNPKCPVPTAMRFLRMLQLPDLQKVGRSHGIPAVVRTAANKLYKQRKTGGGGK